MCACRIAITDLKLRDALHHFEENAPYKEALKDIMLSRIAAAEREEVTNKSFDEIIAEAKQEKYAKAITGV